VTSPVGSSLLRVKRARAFAAKARLEVCAVALDTNERKTDEFSQLEQSGLGMSGMSGLSQEELDSLCVSKSTISDSVTHSHANIMPEGLDQATLDAMSVQDLDDLSTEGDSLEQQLLRIRRCRAFEGPKAASLMVEKETVHFQNSNSLGGFCQSSLDLMCNSEEPTSPEATESADSALCRIRRMRAYQGLDQAESSTAAEQHLLCASIPGGLSQAKLDELCSKGDDSGSDANSDCPVEQSPEQTGSRLLRIRRTRAFLGRQQDLLPVEQSSLAWPAKAREIWSSKDVNISSMTEPTSTTSSTMCSFSEGNDVDVAAAVNKIHMPTRKMRVARGGA